MCEHQHPNSALAKTVWIQTRRTLTGETFNLAAGHCVCPAAHGHADTFRLLSGERWNCPACARIYVFDGERVAIAELGPR